MDIQVLPDASAAAVAGAEWLRRRITSAVRLRGSCSIAVSGGSTPGLMFAALAKMPLPWHDVYIWQVDERVAPDGDPQRNIGLLDVLPLPRKNVRAMPVTAKSLVAAAARYARSLPEQFDIVHLGMGDDGHTASWPPGDPVIDDPQPVALSDEYNGFVRMTLTPRPVNDARSRLVLAPGANKAAVLAGWLLHRADLPIERVRRANTTVIVDHAAAAKLADIAL